MDGIRCTTALRTVIDELIAPFAAQPSVTVDGVAASNVQYVNATTLTATVPAHAAAGSVGVALTTFDGQVLSLTDAFTYVAVPGVVSVTPQVVSQTGGDTVVITGDAQLMVQRKPVPQAAE